MSTTYGHRIVTDGLQLHFDAANIKSYVGTGTALKDLSGKGFNGTMGTGVTFNNINGGAIAFDGGSGHYVSIGTNIGILPMPSGFTLEVFVKATGNTVEAGLFGFTYGLNFYIYNANGYLATSVYSYNPDGSSSNASVAYYGKNYFDNVWHQLVATNNGVSGYLYGDGALKVGPTAQPWSGTTRWQSGFYGIGLNANDGSNTLLGNMAIARVYNRPLSLAEIKQNFNASRGRFGI